MKNTKIQVIAAVMLAFMMTSCSEREDVTSISTKEESVGTASSSSQTDGSSSIAETVTTLTEISSSEADIPSDETSSASDSSEDDKSDFFTQRDEAPSILSSFEDIGLYDIDGNGIYYSFTYNGDEFSAVYTPDHWTITDSYLIDNKQDMEYICQALINEHPIHGSDMESYRTPEDMAYEWVQHNTAYKVLDDSNPWKQNAKDVDLDPYDQGKSVYEIYKDRTSEYQDMTE